MVNIRQHDVTTPILDAAAEEQFQRDWATYAKLVDHDYVGHREVYGILHRVLADLAAPFRFLDLACGDAGGVVGALRGTAVAHYHGVDLSQPALDLARVALEGLACPVELDRRDFVAAMADRPEPADVVWIGLSLHHLQTPDKLTVLRETWAVLGGGRGQMLIFEPTRPDGESRDGYVARFAATTKRLWTALDPDEWARIVDHVARCDFPETVAGWLELGREAGFTEAKELFVASTDLYRMFHYRG